MIRKKMLCIQISDQNLFFYAVSIKKSYLKIINQHNVTLPQYSIHENMLCNMDACSGLITNYLTTTKCSKPLTILSIPHLKNNNLIDNDFKILQALISIKKVPIVLKALITEPISSYKDPQDASKISRSLIDAQHNLLNPYIKHMNKSPRTWLASTVIATGILIFSLSSLTLSTHNATQIVQEKNIELTTQTKKLQQKVHGLHEDSIKRKKNEKKLATIEALFKDKNNFVHLLEMVAQAIPSTTYLTQLHFKKAHDQKKATTLTLDGITPTPEEAITFVHTLTKTASYIKDIALTKLNYSPENKQHQHHHYQFQLQGALKLQ